MKKHYLMFGSLFVFTAIILGAFGAHTLKEVISTEKLDSFETGVTYQIYHGLALLILNATNLATTKCLKWINLLFVYGTLAFSGSIYLLALSNGIGKFLWFVTPLGGFLLILAWGILSYQLFKTKKTSLHKDV